MAARITGIVYLHRDKIEFYSSVSSSVLQLPFPQTAVKDIEIINDEQFQTTITSFIQTNKITGVEIIMVLAPNVFFEKDFVHTEKDLDVQVQIFLDAVPFENIAWKKIPLQNGFKVVATSKTLFETIKRLFERAGNKIIQVSPLIVFGVLSQTLDAQLIKVVSMKAESAKQYDLYEEPLPQATPYQREKPKNNLRLFILIGIFCFLLVISIVLYVFSMKNNTPSINHPPKPPTASHT